jgi:hypothetical protein
MSLGLQIFTLFHVVLSLIGIATGFVVMFALIKAKQLNGWNTWFLWTTIATSVTGYMFPFHKLLPSHIVGGLSLLALALAVFALYKRRLAGGWRRTYAIGAVVALYFNVFVLIVQLFEKVPALRAIAPTQSEAPFKVTQLVTLVAFVSLGVLAAKRFHNARVANAQVHTASA